jgi:hypothetical protein
MKMADVKTGISKTMFVLGLILAILASSLITVAIVTQLPAAKGPKGDTGETGPQGLRGESGISSLPFARVDVGADGTSSAQYGDVKGASANITTAYNSTLLIVFSAALDCQSTKNFSGYVYLRALVDSVPASPNGVEALYVSMGEPTHDPMRAFVFDTVVNPGNHTVSIQWMVATAAFGASIAANSNCNLQVWALPLG